MRAVGFPLHTGALFDQDPLAPHCARDASFTNAYFLGGDNAGDSPWRLSREIYVHI